MRNAERTTASRLGSYEVLHKLAVGGMAELFLARSIGPENFEKLVVLKRILPSLADNDKFVRLFLDEARLAAGLDHPCIAHVYDLGRVDGGYFFTMEYVHGRDIRSVINHSLAGTRPWPIEHALHVASAIAGALHYAHERCGANGQPLGIVHRDVSPANIMVTYEGAVKLLDFGVAKIATSTSKTRTGSLKGKVSYMSPEQAKGAQIDRRSDIFSLGIVLWEMVAMKRLFKADNDLATLQLIINEPPHAPSRLRPDCPAELDRIVVRALSQDPAKRYQTAQEMQLDIENLAREQKLNQSSISLASHMNVLFERDIEAWKRARATGVSLADHIIAWSVEEDPTPSSEFLDGGDDVETSPTNPRLEPGLEDDEKTEQNQVPPAPPPVVAAAPPPAPAKKKKKRIKDFEIPKEPSIVIEPELAQEVIAAPPEPPPAPAPVVIAPAAREPEPVHAHFPATRTRARSRVPIVLGAVGLVAAAAVALVFAMRGADTASSVAPSPPAPPPVASEPPPAPPEPPPPAPEPVAAPAPAPPPAAVVRPQRQAVHPPPPAVRPAPAKARVTPTPKPEHIEPVAPKAAPKFDPNAALPPM